MKANIETKYCPACRREKWTDMFNQNKSTSDGLNTYCCICESARQKNLYEQRKQRACLSGHSVPESEFGVDHSRSDGKNVYCKACVTTRMRQRREEMYSQGLRSADSYSPTYRQKETEPDLAEVKTCIRCGSVVMLTRAAIDEPMCRQCETFPEFVQAKRKTLIREPFERELSLAHLATKLMGASGRYKPAWKIA